MFLRSLKKFFSTLGEDEAWLVGNKTLENQQFLSQQYQIYATPFKLDEIENKILLSTPFQAPSIKHGLEKIIRTEGIYPSDQFPEVVRKLSSINLDLYKRFNTYTPPSKDKYLQDLTLTNKGTYFSGSSSLTECLQQIYYAVTNYKSPDITGLGEGFNHLTMNYMASYRKPSCFWLRKHKKGLYSIESDKGPITDDSFQVLMMGGSILEKLFTTEEEDFQRMADLSKPLSEEDQAAILSDSKSFRYRKLGKFVIRSQIDCGAIDSDGANFVYEIKTRACAPIRYDLENHEKYLDYKILTRKGEDQSYEREYFDLIRSILIKYFFQIKIGRMDGAFIAYHNTVQTFGFEYLSIKEIEKRLFGTPEISDQVIKVCFAVFQDILDEVVEMFPDDELMKVGLFANYLTGELMITIENHEKAIQYPTDPYELKKIKCEVDYYKRYLPGKSALVLCRKIFPYINGILQKEPVFLESGDELTFKQMKYVRGMMSVQDYMYFLLHAYKSDSLTKHAEFKGVWKKYNDFHVYRKPLYRSI